MTIQKWNLNNELKFVCYEYDKTVIPILLFNLAARNIDAVVVNGDALQDEVFATAQTAVSSTSYYMVDLKYNYLSFLA